MKEIKLSNRLSAIAAFAADFERVADVGTDHGYVPIWLIQSGKARSVVASDIKEGPLNRARETARAYGVENGIEFILSNGLEHLDKDSVDAVIIAGMGGETIAGIISETDWVADGQHSFILQPMTKTAELLTRLYEKGLCVKDARIAEDEGEMYLILLAEAGKMKMPSEAELNFPRILLDKKDPLAAAYLDRLIERTSSAIEGIKKGRGQKGSNRLPQLVKTLEGYIAMKGEL